jgi:hypothetical protein
MTVHKATWRDYRIITLCFFSPLQPYIQFNGRQISRYSNVPSRCPAVTSASPTTPREKYLEPEFVEHGLGPGTQLMCNWEL